MFPRSGHQGRPGALAYTARMPLNEALRSGFQWLIAADEVVLFMKGNRARPQCGFSASVVQVLDELVPSYRTPSTCWPIRRCATASSCRRGRRSRVLVREVSAGPTLRPRDARLGRARGAPGGRAQGNRAAAITVTPRAAAVFHEATADAGPDDVIRLSVTPALRAQPRGRGGAPGGRAGRGGGPLFRARPHERGAGGGVVLRLRRAGRTGGL